MSKKQRINIDLASQTGGISAFDNITKRALATERGRYIDAMHHRLNFTEQRLNRAAIRKGVDVNDLTGYVEKGKGKGGRK